MEDQLEEDKQRILLWIDWRTSSLANIEARIDEMDAEEQWCFSWLGTDNVKLALNEEFLEQVFTQKYVDLNQRTADKGKGVAIDDDAGKAANVARNEDYFDEDDENDDIAEAIRRSLVMNYAVEEGTFQG